MPACVGTAALIWAGTGGHHLVGRLLSLAPFVWIGLISYSLYLWHWPVLIAARMIEGSAVLDLPLAWACIGLSLALAFLSWKFVEQPFRRKARMAAPARKQIFGFSAGGIFLLGSVSAGVALADGLPLRLGASTIALHADATRLHPLDRQCTTQGKSPNACPVGSEAPGAQVAYVLWGDSHAGAMISGFDHWLKREGKAGIAFAKAACAPMLGLRRADMGSRHGCDTHNAAVLERILADYPQATIVLVGRWTMLAMGTRMTGEPGGLAILTTSAQPASGIAANAALLENGLAELVARLRQADRRVVLLAGVPEPGFHVPNNQARAAMLGTVPREVSRATFDQRIATSDPLLVRVAERYGARLVRPADFLCDDTRCGVLLAGKPLYRDDDHLSIAGAAWLVPRMMAAAAS
ncbi:acyltransferase family protein [Alteraurantiacibacter palmitatis]|uniref:Acyltransferase family protein n=1 Tax=Alteraurantiacibacter palmitatis TaxID=2054628 RepID=A0ABV7E6S1_9SPHN